MQLEVQGRPRGGAAWGCHRSTPRGGVAWGSGPGQHRVRLVPTRPGSDPWLSIMWFPPSGGCLVPSLPAMLPLLPSLWCVVCFLPSSWCDPSWFYIISILGAAHSVPSAASHTVLPQVVPVHRVVQSPPASQPPHNPELSYQSKKELYPTITRET